MYNFALTVNRIRNDSILKLDFRKVRNDYRKFKSLLTVRKKNQFETRKQFESMMRLINARRYFDNMIVLYKSFFDPTVNAYILDAEKNHQSYKNLSTHVGIVSGTLDLLQSDFKILENQASQYASNPVAPAKITNFKQTLLTYTDALIIFSLVTAYEKFITFNPEDHKNDKGKVPIKDRLLFSWLLFKEFSRVAEHLGSVARQMAYTEALTKLRSLENDTKTFKSIPSMPSNIKYEQEPETAPEAISDPFEDGGLEIGN